MTATLRVRATVPAVVAALLLLTGCGSDDNGDSATVGMGWIPKEDEPTGVDFALPAPAAGPQEQRRQGRRTSVDSRSYAGRAGELTLSVQFLSTPESPQSLDQELPVDRMPQVVTDQLAEEGDYEVDVLSNERVDAEQRPTYDARLRVSSAEDEALWTMRTRAYDDFVLVTQVVGFSEGESGPGFQQQVATAFERLDDTVAVPESLP
jgi:hypothetical protein